MQKITTITANLLPTLYKRQYQQKNTQKGSIKAPIMRSPLSTTYFSHPQPPLPFFKLPFVGIPLDMF